ncbi:hypothetical protein ABT039_19695 [Streptomyces lasiicapitis]|uniref:hypothetical protein n=1 Tax=Streptomyces lasiicapitis TaxID=1923961 RepID=UPI00332D30F6
MKRGELARAFVGESDVFLQAKGALAAGAVFEIWPGSIPAGRLHRTYVRRLHRAQALNRPSLGFEEAVASLASSGSQELLIGYIDDRERGGHYYQLFLTSDLARVVGCIGVQAISRDDADPDMDLME